MRVLFVSHNFPPEVNAPANRLAEHARYWAALGGQIHVLTAVPNYPEGKVYKGYRNRLTRETDETGVQVTRVPLYVTPNQGTRKRMLSFASFMCSAVWYSLRVKPKPDVVVATSPQFLTAVAGYLISRLKRVPFVLEIRDLWPESIVAVGAMPRNRLIRMLEWLERFIYRKAHHIVAVTNRFKIEIVAKGIPPDKVSVLKNGVDLSFWNQPLDPTLLQTLKKQYHLDQKFVVSYIGTIGMAHRADILLEAARHCPDPDILFLVVGAGAEREQLAQAAEAAALPNFLLLDKQPRDRIPYLLTLSHLSVVHLIDAPLFRTVIPSKIFEAMALGKPILLGVEGEARELVEEAEAGIAIPPEDAAALVEAARKLKQDPAHYATLAQHGQAFVSNHYSRSVIAGRYLKLLQNVVAPRPAQPAEPAPVNH